MEIFKLSLLIILMVTILASSHADDLSKWIRRPE